MRAWPAREAEESAGALTARIERELEQIS
jgi:hypothetical protein